MGSCPGLGSQLNVSQSGSLPTFDATLGSTSSILFLPTRPPQSSLPSSSNTAIPSSTQNSGLRSPVTKRLRSSSDSNDQVLPLSSVPDIEYVLSQTTSASNAGTSTSSASTALSTLATS